MAGGVLLLLLALLFETELLLTTELAPFALTSPLGGEQMSSCLPLPLSFMVFVRDPPLGDGLRLLDVDDDEDKLLVLEFCVVMTEGPPTLPPPRDGCKSPPSVFVLALNVAAEAVVVIRPLEDNDMLCCSFEPLVLISSCP